MPRLSRERRGPLWRCTGSWLEAVERSLPTRTRDRARGEGESVGDALMGPPEILEKGTFDQEVLLEAVTPRAAIPRPVLRRFDEVGGFE